MIHPLIVHLPIGIILLATIFEWLVRSERQTFLGHALPFIWRLGAASAVVSCLSGWWMRQSGSYSGETIDLHQWIGIGTAVLAVAICFMSNRFWWGNLAAVGLVVTGHFGGSLTHGEGYLFAAAQQVAAAEESGLLPSLAELPDTTVQFATPEQLARLRKSGLIVSPLGQNSPWLSVGFMNMPAPPDSVFDVLLSVAPQVTRLHLGGATIPESAWQKLGQLPCLSSIYLNGSNVSDGVLSVFARHRFLANLNLSNTKVTAAGVTQLAGLKKLKKVYLFQTEIKSSEWPGVFSALPGVMVDTGNYVVPTLPTDTTELKAKKAY